MVSLITSIPPFHSKREIDGDDFTGAYQIACRDSWSRLGAEVVSVNSEVESGAHTAGHNGYSVVTVDTDGSAACGKPLVSWNDLVNTAIGRDSDQILFLNSDIFVHRTDELLPLISELRPGNAIVGRRVNIKSLKGKEAAIYRLGFDLFAVHREDVDLLRSPIEIFFGDPWWDYVALCNLLLRGVTVSTCDPIHILHLFHEAAFSKERWSSIGIEIMGHMFKNLPHRGTALSNHSSLAIAELITACHDQVERVNSTAKNQEISQLRSECNLPGHDSALRMFSHGLIHHTETALNFQPDGLDPLITAQACAVLSEEMSRLSLEFN